MSIGSREDEVNAKYLVSDKAEKGYDGVQLELFPLGTLIEKPNTTGTADAWGEVEATDTHNYIVKTDNCGAHVRASEWIGTHIAELLLMPCATPKIIRMQTGELFFGSRMIYPDSLKSREKRLAFGGGSDSDRA